MQVHKIDGFIFKVDFSKAYDSVDWSCLIHIMRCLQMGETWIKWLKTLLESTKMSILVNGSPTPEFYTSKGLKQGDLFSPLLVSTDSRSFKQADS